MGFDDCSSFGEQIGSFVSTIGQVGYSAEEVSHAIGELSKALNGYSHAEGYSSSLSSSPVRPATIIMMSIVRKPVLKLDRIKNATLTVDNVKIDWDILEKNFGSNWAFDRGLY